MLQALATMALAPLLIWQGKRVRATALELPEAPGARYGLGGSAPAEFRLLVLGDSAAAGVGVRSQEEAITGCLVRALGSVQWQLLARTGHRLIDVVRELEQAGLDGTSFDLVVVSAGINDVLQGTSSMRWRKSLERLAAALERLAAPRCVAFSGIPRIQDFPLLPQPLAWYLGLRAQRLNQVTLQFMAQAPRSWRHVTLDLPLSPDHLARDGFHPNEKSCQLWCEQVTAVVSMS